MDAAAPGRHGAGQRTSGAATRTASAGPRTVAVVPLRRCLPRLLALLAASALVALGRRVALLGQQVPPLVLVVRRVRLLLEARASRREAGAAAAR